MFAAKLFRKLHRAGAIVALAPLLVVLLSGLLLQVRKDIEWVQPSEAEGTQSAPSIRLEEALAAARSANVGIDSWADVERMEVRPTRGIVKVRGLNRHEVQVDATTGAVLKAGPRRSDLIESIHDGSWFHERARFWIFLPAALVVFSLWCTGLYLWLLPHRIRRRKRQNMFA